MLNFVASKQEVLMCSCLLNFSEEYMQMSRILALHSNSLKDVHPWCTSTRSSQQPLERPHLLRDVTPVFASSSFPGIPAENKNLS